MFSAHIKLLHIFDHLILLENSFSYENKQLKIIKNALHCKKIIIIIIIIKKSLKVCKSYFSHQQKYIPAKCLKNRSAKID